MSCKIRRLNVLLTALFAFLAILVSQAATWPPSDSLPSFQTIKSLEYTKASDHKENGVLGYSEL